jgi:rhodanese-related sulfurtransferase
MFKSFFSRAPDPADLDLETVAKAVRAGDATVVDVREPHEFVAGHIPGAMNLPLSRFDPRRLPMGGLVVLVCQAGGRSRYALARAHAAGRSDVKHFAGGMSQWRLRGENVTV